MALCNISADDEYNDAKSDVDYNKELIEYYESLVKKYERKLEREGFCEEDE